MKKVLGWVRSRFSKVGELPDRARKAYREGRDRARKAYREGRPKLMAWTLHRGHQFHDQLDKFLSFLQVELYSMGAEGADVHGYSLNELWGRALVPNEKQWGQITSHAHWDQGKHVYKGGFLPSRGGTLASDGFVGTVRDIRQKARDLGQEYAEGYREFRAERMRLREKEILARYAQGVLEEVQRRKEEGDEISQWVLATMLGANVEDYKGKIENLWSGNESVEVDIRKEWGEVFRKRRAEELKNRSAEESEENEVHAAFSQPQIVKVTTEGGDVSYVTSNTPPRPDEVSREEVPRAVQEAEERKLRRKAEMGPSPSPSEGILSALNALREVKAELAREEVEGLSIAELHGNDPEVLEALEEMQKEVRPAPEDSESEPDSEHEEEEGED